MKLSVMILVTLGFLATNSYACMILGETDQKWVGFPNEFTVAEIEATTVFSRVNFTEVGNKDHALAQVNLGNATYIAMAIVGGGGVFSKCYSIDGAEVLSQVQVMNAAGQILDAPAPDRAMIPVLNAIHALTTGSGVYSVDYTDVFTVKIISNDEISVAFQLSNPAPMFAVVDVRRVDSAYGGTEWKIFGDIIIAE